MWFAENISWRQFRRSLGAFSAIVCKDGSTVWAEDATGKTIASGESGVDDASVIQKALASLTLNRRWKERIVLKGDFIVRDSILLDDYTILDLTQSRLFLAKNANVDIIKNKDQANGNEHIEIWGGMLFGNKDEQTSYMSGIYFKAVNNFKIIGARFHACRNSATKIRACINGIIAFSEADSCGTSTQEAGFVCGESKRITFEMCFAYNGGRGGFEIEDGCGDIHLKNCYAWKNGDNDFNTHSHPDFGPNDTIIFENCYAGYSPYGFYLLGDNQTPKNDYHVRLISCTSISNTKGIYAARQIDLEIYKCIIQNYKEYGVDISDTTGLKIRDVTIDYSTSTSIYAYRLQSCTNVYELDVVTRNISDGGEKYLSNVKLWKNVGTATFSGDGTTTDFEIGAHGLVTTDPSKIAVKVTPASSDAIAASPCVGYVDPVDNTKIKVKFSSAPASGSGNVKIVWYAEVIS